MPALAMQTAGKGLQIIQIISVGFLLHLNRNMLDLLLICIPENKRVFSKICLIYYFPPFHGIWILCHRKVLPINISKKQLYKNIKG